MAANGFLEQKPSSPTGFGLVLLLHGAAIAGVVMIKNPPWQPPADPLNTYVVPPVEPPPPDEPPPPTGRQELPAPPQAPFIPQPPVRPALDQPTMRGAEQPTTVWDPGEPARLADGGGVATLPARRADPPRTPVRVAAQFDPRFARAMQPPYPAAEQRAEREGSVRVRVTIGTDGRVRAVQRLSATSDAFWRVTEEQALSRWRFRPATEDGRPVESSKDLIVHFRLDS